MPESAHESPDLRPPWRDADDAPLVLTASIDPGQVPFVALRDGFERAIQYYCAVIRWLRDSSIRDLVLVENTATRVDFGVLQDLAHARGKRLEVLRFAGNGEAQHRGKGFGEGRILEYALEHSSLLAGRPAFYKCTGRLFVANFDELAPALCGRANTFLEQQGRLSSPLQGELVHVLARLDPVWGAWSASGRRQRVRRALHRTLGLPLWVDTRFFRAEVDFFRHHLLQAHRRCDDLRGVYLEHAFHHALRRFPESLVWRAPIRWVGMSATLGCPAPDQTDYDSDLRKEAVASLIAGNPGLGRNE